MERKSMPNLRPRTRTLCALMERSSVETAEQTNVLILSQFPHKNQNRIFLLWRGLLIRNDRSRSR